MKKPTPPADRAVRQLGAGAGVGFTQEQHAVSLVIRNGRPVDVIAFEEAIVGFFVDAAEMLGVPKSVAAIYGICFASGEPLGFTEIDDRLNISAGSISQGLRVLREMGALKVVTAPFEKRDRFEPDMELRKLATHFIEERLEGQLKAGRCRLDLIKTSIPAGATATSTLQERIDALHAWHARAYAVLPIIKTFLKLT